MLLKLKNALFVLVSFICVGSLLVLLAPVGAIYSYRKNLTLEQMVEDSED